MRRLAILSVILCWAAPAAADDLTVALADPAWDGKAIPAGQHCTKFGGHGATPPLAVANLPAGTDFLVVAFGDHDYQPLSQPGGHGTIGFAVPAGATAVTLPAVPGERDDLPAGAEVVARNWAKGSYAVPGYLPPCSGGKNHRYFARVIAQSGGAEGDDLAETEVEIGRY